MKTNLTLLGRIPQLLLSLLLLGTALPACSDDEPARPAEFTIGDARPSDFYRIPFSREIFLSGTGFQPTDIVRFTDTGISGNTYRIALRAEAAGASVLLPSNFVDSEYDIHICRNGRECYYGRAAIAAKVDIPDREGMNIKGQVYDGTTGLPLAGVVVSDGRVLTTTDEEGRYWLQSEKRTLNPHVFVSIPSGYMPAEVAGQFPEFFKRIPTPDDPEAVDTIDFSLEPVADEKFLLAVITDTHLGAAAANKAPEQFTNYVAPDLNDFIQTNKAAGRPVYVLELGDLTTVHRATCPLDEAKRLLLQIRGRIFPIPGNHELNDYVAHTTLEEAQGAARDYLDLMGPLWYSFNIGGVHFVALNSQHKPTGSTEIDYYISDEEYDWLRRDLATVADKEAPVVVMMHRHLFQNYSYSTQLDDIETFKECFRDFREVHVFTGHTHRSNCTTEGNITEHNCNPLGGTNGGWTSWRLPTALTERHQGVNTDGAPAGYKVVSFEQGRIVDWGVKGINLPLSRRMQIYDRNTIDFSPEKVLSPALLDRQELTNYISLYAANYGPDSSNEILVRLWDASWSVEIFEEGQPLTVVRKQLFDPLYLAAFGIALCQEGSAPSSNTPATWHMFSAKASSPSSTVTVRLTDRFGHVTEETVTRPKPFTVTYD